MAKDPLIAAGIKKKQANAMYVRAKIQISPQDYTLKDRVLYESDMSNFSHATSVFHMTADTEMAIAGRLGASEPADFKVLDCMLKHNGSKYDIPGYDDQYYDLYDLRDSSIGIMYKRNDLMLYTPRAADLVYIASEKGLEALMKLTVALNENGAIYPYLMLSRFAETNALSLDEIVNLSFVRNAIDNGKHCVLQSNYQGVAAIDLLSMCAFKDMYQTNADPHNVQSLDGSVLETRAEYARQNLIVGMMFFCELQRAFNKLEESEKDLLAPHLYLLNNPLHGHNFLDYFGSYDPNTFRYVCQPIDDICQMPNAADRFNAIRELVPSTVMKVPSVAALNGSNYFAFATSEAFPEFLYHILSDMFHKSWEIFRTQNFALMLMMCKERNIDISDLQGSNESTGSGNGGGGLQMFGNDNDDFGDMMKGTKYTDPQEESSLTGNQSPSKPRQQRPDKLDTMSNLLSSCDPKYRVTIQDMPNDMGLKNAYLKLLAPIDMITKQLTKQIRAIKTYNVGGKNSGLSRGKLDSHTMYRYKTDPRIFYNNTYKVKEMDLAFGIILDQSGSMCGDGIREGMISLILLHHVLTSLRINHAIVGHNSHGFNEAIIKRYVHFNEDPKHTLETPYMLANLKTSGGNCDSGALNYMEQYIKRAHNKDKIVIIFSDGEPSECEESDLKKQVRKMEREGIHVIGLGINFDSIKYYYPDNANGRSIKEMVDILVTILKSYVLEKK